MKKCISCEKEFKSYHLLLFHMREHNNMNEKGEPTFKCDYPNCDKEFLKHKEKLEHRVFH